MPGPFDDLIPASRSSAPPAFIPGTPKTRDPLDDASKNQALINQQQALINAQLEEENKRLKNKAEENRFNATGGVDGTEGENKAAALTTNLQSAMNNIRAVTKADPSAAKPGLLELGAGMFGEDAKEYVQSSERRDVAGSQFIAVDSALTLATGAAYTPSQLEGYTRSLFPTLNDTPSNIASKRRKFEQIIQAGRLQAGAKAPNIEQAIAAVDAIYGPVGGGGVGGTKSLQEAFDGGATFDEIMQLAEQQGVPDPVRNELLAAIKYRDEGGKGATFNPPEGGGGGSDLGQALYAGVGDVAEFAGNTLGLIGNPLNAGINAMVGTNLSTDLGQTFRNATGAPNGDPLASAINQGGLSAMTGVGIGNALAGARGATGAVANALASQPVQQVAGGVAAGASAEGARQAGAPAPLQLAAGIAGGVGGFAGTNAMLRAAQPSTLAPVAQAARNQGVNMLPADTGGTAVKILTSGAKASPLSAGPIRKAAQTAQGQMKSATERLTDDIGGSLTTDKAGEAVRRAGNQYAEKTSARGERLYTSAYSAAGGVKAIKPRQTIVAIDEQIARLAQNPEKTAAATAKELQDLKTKLSGGVSIQGLRDARTSLSQGVYDGKMRSGAEKGMWKKILSNVADDIDAGLRSAGKPQAAELFKRADKFWSERVEQIDNVLQPIIGKEGQKGGEQILASIESMARGQSGGNARLSRLLAEMPDEYGNRVRATIIERLGKSNPGAQTAEGDAFAPSTFLTNWNKMTPQAKASIFSDTKLRRNLDDLALISENMKATESFSNFSNTAMAVAGGGQSVGAIAVGTLLHPIAAAAIGGTQFATGKLLASPRFAEWLARTSKISNPNAYNAQVKRLDSIAAAEPIIANDIASIKQFLANSPGLSKAAASDEVNEERPVKP